GVSKILDPATFAEDIDNYRILPYLLVSIVAVVLPWLEVLCGISLISGKFKSGALFILVGLSLIFLIAISSALVRGLDISCGCFSTNNEATRIGLTKLFENIALLAATVFLFHQSDRK
ncbi:DoxX family protein, partial [candidate division KSB1 bacterium]|nr:DoxX family protein [candidate division KSB1 bacterium]